MSPAAGRSRSPTIWESSLGELRTLIVEPVGGGSSAVIALRGATVLSWRVQADGGSVELIDGYTTADEFRSEDGMRSAVMAPFTNRIAGSRYTFDGREAVFRTDGSAAAPDIMHGLLRDQDFDVTNVTERGATTTVELSSRALRPGAFDGYPYAVDVSATYTLRSDAIDITLAAKNVGEDAAPYSCGWHPYFRLGNAELARLELRVPADARVVTDVDLIPLDGAAAIQPLAATDPLDFRTPRQIGESLIDACYVDLARSRDGLIHTEVSDPTQALHLDVWQERGSVHVYTGDALERSPRGSLAIEPIEALTNAFNRPDQSDSIRLEPGEHRSFRFGVTVHVS